jgi:phosphoesterase RecJ-like protein
MTIEQILEKSSSFFLTTASPDGDSVGSMQALGIALHKRGKKVSLYFPEPVPENLKFLSGKELIVSELPAAPFDVMIVMDTGSSKLLLNGDKNAWRKIARQIVNVDHHPDNDQFGEINYCFPEAASTGEIIFQILTNLKWEITSEIASCLLTAVMADTGIFKYPNVTSTTYSTASSLLKTKINNGEIARQLYASYSYAYAKLLGRMFSNLKKKFDGKLAWSILSQEDFAAAEAAEEDGDKMVEHLDILKDVHAFALFRQMKDGVVKISLRSRNKLPVNKIAALFGGGGHLQAAGCKINASLKEAEEKIVGELGSFFS